MNFQVPASNVVLLNAVSYIQLENGLVSQLLIHACVCSVVVVGTVANVPFWIPLPDVPSCDSPVGDVLALSNGVDKKYSVQAHPLTELPVLLIH